ncbi:MAG: pyrrolo-quinoline quinone [Zetaproteobacteria bacterium CG12_big_fil_rev_8_21_14_0_65_54_13]|nr:MAG: pyrrolo-quinoline quinone [Zetaproteobacteria bacterium CG12_big_fil_rev_8_21_14_0_65_54_13]PIX55727.1 MAG: pyrrolo-quinoline quinone [Zetaproteobacteria bacterium CG_4_10_14_3_um_filter_54_28]PJA30539.1 MAG: pyrrolo-quinoline quinone [Zetaproteobacteria bacterium CG_4_9_14_3_um_filter_54_145]
MGNPMRHAFIPLLMSVALGGCATVGNLWQDAPASADKAVTPAATASGPAITMLWRNNLDQRKPASPPGFSLPAVVTTTTGDLIVAGSQDRRLRAYDMSGSEVTRVALDAPVESGALKLTNGLVVVGDVGGNLYGVDLQQGVKKWRYTLSSALIGRPVAVDSGFIIQTSNNQIYRFTADGKKVWSFSGLLGGLAMHLSPSPVVYNGRIYASLSNGDVVALNADNGGFLWKRQTILNNEAAVLSELKVPVASPTVIPAAESGLNEDLLAVPIFQGQLMFLSLQDGSTLRSRDLSLKSSPLLIGSKLYVADAQGAVSALDAASGETLWKKQLSDGELTGPIMAAGLLWLADDHGRVYRMEQDGRVAGRIELEGRIDRTPVATGNGVLVRNNLGILYMLR